MQGTSHSGRAWWRFNQGAHSFRGVVVTTAIALSFWSAVLSTGIGGRPLATVLVRSDRPVTKATDDTTVLARADVRRTQYPAPSTTTTPPIPSSAATSTIAAPAPAPPVASVVPAVTTTCADALAYLTSHAAPDFVASCGPGNSMGRYGYTCWNVAPHCGNGGRIIHIACPAPFVYQNEAHNSWALIGQRSGIDPYGQGGPAEQTFCDRYR